MHPHTIWGQRTDGAKGGRTLPHFQNSILLSRINKTGTMDSRKGCTGSSCAYNFEPMTVLNVQTQGSMLTCQTVISCIHVHTSTAVTDVNSTIQAKDYRLSALVFIFILKSPHMVWLSVITRFRRATYNKQISSSETKPVYFKCRISGDKNNGYWTATLICVKNFGNKQSECILWKHWSRDLISSDICRKETSFTPTRKGTAWFYGKRDKKY